MRCGGKNRIQVSKKEFHTYIHLGYARIEFLSYNGAIELCISIFENTGFLFCVSITLTLLMCIVLWDLGLTRLLV